MELEREESEHTVERLEVVEAGSRSHISFLSLRDLISLYLRTGSPLLIDRQLANYPSKLQTHQVNNIRDSKTDDSC